MIVYLNGEYVPLEKAVVPVLDRGFIFGDGVYEVTRVVEGRLFEGERHQARLEAGLAAVRITPPAAVQADTLRDIAMRLLEENGHMQGQATIYVQVTRGAAPRAHAFPAAGTPPTVYVATNAFKPIEEVRAAGASAVTQPDTRWQRCNVKTIQLLPNVLAKQVAAEAGAFEALFVREGVLMEGTHSNLFAVLDDELRTHPANEHILPGITREVVLELAAELGIPVREDPITEQDLPGVQELFVSGTTTDVLPIVTVDGRRIADGKPGDVSMRLYEALVARMQGVGAGR